MLILRWVGAILLVLCGGAWGRAATQQVVARRKALEDTAALLERMEQEILYRQIPFSGILTALQREAPFSALDFSRCSSLHQLPAPQVLQGSEQAMFHACFSGLGHNAADAECQRLRYYAVRFRQAAENAAESEQQARRIYPKLGLGAAAMLAIALV